MAIEFLSLHSILRLRRHEELVDGLGYRSCVFRSAGDADSVGDPSVGKEMAYGLTHLVMPRAVMVDDRHHPFSSEVILIKESIDGHRHIVIPVRRYEHHLLIVMHPAYLIHDGRTGA